MMLHIKWQKNSEDIDNISKIQFNILNTCSKYLKEEGELVYSTCSIFKKENRKIVEKFLNENSNFELKELKIKEKFFLKYLVKNKFLEVYQNEKTDGFFICKIGRKKGK